MDEIKAHLHSPGWWFTLIFGGLLIYLLGPFVRDGLRVLGAATRRGVSRLAGRNREWAKQARLDFELEAERLSQDTCEIVLTSLRVSRVTSMSIFSMLCSLVFMFMAREFEDGQQFRLATFSIVMAGTGALSYLPSIRLQSILTRAREIRGKRDRIKQD